MIQARDQIDLMSQFNLQPQLAFAHSNQPLRNQLAEEGSSMSLLDKLLRSNFLLKSEGGDKPPKGFEKFFKKKEEREKEGTSSAPSSKGKE